VRTISSGLNRDEALAVAYCREVQMALEILWDAIHREDHEDYFDSELIGDELKGAFDALLKVKGVRS
jgi:hypothetical protein